MSDTFSNSTAANSSVANSMDSAPAIYAALAISAVGAIFYNMLPLFIGTAQDQMQLSDERVGFIGSAFFLGYNLVTLTAFFWIRRFSWKTICLVSMPLAALSLVVAILFPGYETLLLSVCISGGAFSAFYGVGATALGDTAHPAKWFGMKIAVEALLGAVLLFLLPVLVIEFWGFNGVLAAMAVTTLLFIPCIAKLPSAGAKSGGDVSSKGEKLVLSLKHRFAILISLAAILAFFMGASAAWTFVERMGSDGGHDPVTVGGILSLTLVFAVAGSLTVAWISDRFGYFKPHLAAVLGYLLGLLFLSQSADLLAYGIGACLLTFAIGIAIPVLISITAMLDTDGRYIVLSVPALGLGAMIGPGVAGYLTGGVSYTPILVFTAISCVVSLLLVAFALLMAKQEVIAADTHNGCEQAGVSG